MTSIMLFQLLVLLGLSWIITSLPIPGETNEGQTLPEITSCAYVNAYYVQCWWKRSKNDATYRLGYTSAADAKHARREIYCDKTEQTIDGDVITESCGIRGYMFGRFTLWVASVHDCDGTTGSCESIARSKDIEFTCTRENVKLTIPPASLTIDSDGHRLSWTTPDRELSMLSFVLRRRNVLYKVEHRELIEGTVTNWEELPTTYETSLFLPTLVPGVSYEFRVFASLDAPGSKSPSPSERAANDVEREWTDPSNVLVFMTPRTMKSIEEDSVFKSVEKVEMGNEQTTTSEIGIIRPAQVSQRIIVASAVTSFIVVVVLAILGYFLPWKRWCCTNSTKFIRPSVFVDFRELTVEGNEKSIGNESPSKKTTEDKICPITQLITNESEINIVQGGIRYNRNRYSVLSRSGRNASNVGRQQLLLPSQNLDDSISVNEMLDLVQDQNKDVGNNVTMSDDVASNTSHDDVASSSKCWETNQQKSETRKYWGGSRYLKLDKNEEIPSYLMASMKSLDRTMSDYIADDTGIGSTFLTDSSYATDMMSSGDEEKEKQWQKYLFESVKEEDDDSDDIPDYVMHAPSFNKEFCKNMTSFLSMATSDVTQREPVADYTVTEEPTPKEDVTKFCSILREEKVLLHMNENSRFDNDGTSQFVIMAMCRSCKNCQKHEKCQTNTTTDHSDDLHRVHRHRSFHHRGSVSDHSTDSGYSPDSPDCVIVTSKDNILGSTGGIRGSQASSDNESDDEYMTYVATS